MLVRHLSASTSTVPCKVVGYLTSLQGTYQLTLLLQPRLVHRAQGKGGPNHIGRALLPDYGLCAHGAGQARGGPH